MLLNSCFRVLEDGDIVNVDVTVYYKGVHGEEYVSFRCVLTDHSTSALGFNVLIAAWSFVGDLNETYFVGNVDEASRKLVQCTYECLEKAISIGW